MTQKLLWGPIKRIVYMLLNLHMIYNNSCQLPKNAAAKTGDPRLKTMLHLHVMHIFSPVLTPACSDWLLNEVLRAHCPAMALLCVRCFRDSIVVR